MLRKGFAECFRVLKPHGTLIFKWAESEYSLREVVRTYAMLGGRKHLFYRDELLKHLNLKT